MSDAKATACRSNISLTCSSNESGTPIGASGSSRCSPLVLRASTCWMRRSISRMSSRYSPSRARSLGAELAPQPADSTSPIQSRMLRSSVAAFGALLRRRADAEQLIEHDARVAHHRQRLLGRGPADRVGVDAGVAVGAAAGLVDVLDAQLHRRNRRVLPELLRVHLIERDAGEDVGALGLLRMRLREEHRATSGNDRRRSRAA